MRDATRFSLLVAINDSISSRSTVDFLCHMPLARQQMSVTLLHILRKPQAGEALMGKKFMSEQPKRMMIMLEKTRDVLVEKGFEPKNITIELVTEEYDTVGDGIADQFSKGHYHIVLIGRKRMSKAEEFVLGDPSVKLIRTLNKTAVIVVKPD